MNGKLFIDISEEDLTFKIEKDESEPDVFIYRLYIYPGGDPISIAHICLNEDQIQTIKTLFEKARYQRPEETDTRIEMPA